MRLPLSSCIQGQRLDKPAMQVVRPLPKDSSPDIGQPSVRFFCYPLPEGDGVSPCGATVVPSRGPGTCLRRQLDDC